ncbi:MAG: flagellar export chaperone FliS [Spirochaetales bacterium]|nr:flagellar export chaperone FliS [Spirochaetales bacterium]
MKENPLKAYKETQIKTATPGKLVIMLYDEAIKCINLAIDRLKKNTKKLDEVNNNIIKAQDVVSELMASLDFDKGGEIAKNLFSIYTFINKQLLHANIKKEAEPMEQVVKMLIDLRAAWVEVAGKTDTVSDSKRYGGVDLSG